MRKPVLLILIVVVVVTLTAGLSIQATFKAVPSLFARNAELKAQGYYMGEFEFKMLGVLHYLNTGRYIRAYLTMRRIINEMETTQGLLKMPESASSEELMTFLLERQDPATGAFMDARYPIFTYIGPTANVIDTLDQLARQSGRPLRLNHPLSFLGEIRTAEQLRAYLEPLLYIREPWSEMGGPGPYGAGISELPVFEDFERRGLYRFSEEWKDALRKWYYETQDPATGFWGARIGTPAKWRQNLDPNSTYHIIKFVVDEWGENRSAKYPLRYAAALVNSLLDSLAAPLPDDPVQQHEWGLNQAQGARIITRRLWSHLSEAQRNQVRTDMQTWLTSRYQLFRPVDGGFSVHTSAIRADLDGTSSALMLLQATGSLPGTRERERIWGEALTAPSAELIPTKIDRRRDEALSVFSEANSVRIYKNSVPIGDTYDDANLVQIVYPGESPILDIMDLRQQIARFLATKEQRFGNWASKESLRDRPLDLQREIKVIPVAHGSPDSAGVLRAHPDAERLYLIGYDVFQVPVSRSLGE